MDSSAPVYCNMNVRMHQCCLCVEFDFKYFTVFSICAWQYNESKQSRWFAEVVLSLSLDHDLKDLAASHSFCQRREVEEILKARQESALD